jgi:hypothetical protein
MLAWQTTIHVSAFQARPQIGRTALIHPKFKDIYREEEKLQANYSGAEKEDIRLAKKR